MWNKHEWCIGRERTRERFENHDSLQTKATVNSKRKNEIIKDNFKKMHVQLNKWKNHNGNATCWAFYYVLILAKCVFTFVNFDLWVSKMAHDVFALIVKFLRED